MTDQPTVSCEFMDMTMDDVCGIRFPMGATKSMHIPPSAKWPEAHYCPTHAEFLRSIARED